jgi:hypothetical protein
VTGGLATEDRHGAMVTLSSMNQICPNLFELVKVFGYNANIILTSILGPHNLVVNVCHYETH